MTAVEHEAFVIRCPLESSDADTQIVWSRVRYSAGIDIFSARISAA